MGGCLYIWYEEEIKLNIVICDDDKNILQYLKVKIENILEQDCQIETFENGYDVIEYINHDENKVDIIFMDIDLKEHIGIDIVKEIQKNLNHIKIIFMTGYAAYVEDIFEVETLYYLAKPINEEKLKKALNKAVESIKKDKEEILNIKIKKQVISINLSDVNYIESHLRTIIIHCGKVKKTIYKKLDEIEEILPANFIRCHQSYIVNMDKVNILTINKFILKNGEKVPVSQSKYKYTKEEFLNYLGESI